MARARLCQIRRPRRRSSSQRCAEPACHEMSQMNLTAVFKIVDDLANDTAAAVCGHRCIKVNCAMGAVGAGERAGNSAFEGLGALLAKWRNDTHGLCFALLAEIFASSTSCRRKLRIPAGKEATRPLRTIQTCEARSYFNQVRIIIHVRAPRPSGTIPTSKFFPTQGRASIC